MDMALAVEISLQEDLCQEKKEAVQRATHDGSCTREEKRLYVATKGGGMQQESMGGGEEVERKEVPH